MTTAIAEKEHAVLGPSGWDRWSTCPGSVVLEEGFPNRTSTYAAWGTVAHEVASMCLLYDSDAEGYLDKVYTVEGHTITVDMEMADCVNTYLGVVHSLIDEEAGDVLMIEQEVPIGHLTGESGATGTADVIGIVNNGKRLVVVDFKGGAGVPVYAYTDVEEQFAAAGCTPSINGQMGMYALGALEKYGLIYEDIAEVELVISQPRVSEEPSSIVISVDELHSFGEEVRLAAGRVELARQIDVVANIQGAADVALELYPSEKACKFCRARSSCPALRAEVEGSLAMVSSAEPAEFEDLTLPRKAASVTVGSDTDVERLASFMRAAPLIEEALKAVRAEVERRLLDGQAVPGYYLGEGKKGNRRWKDEAKAEAELRKRYKVPEIFEMKLISPSKAEKLMKPKPRLWAKVVEAAGIDQGEGKPSVCREGIDKNKPYQIGAAPEDFADLTTSDYKPTEKRVGSDPKVFAELSSPDYQPEGKYTAESEASALLAD